MSAVNKMMCTLGLVGLLAAPTMALTVSELGELLENETSITLIDIREASFFQRGHIPNAIHVSARVLPLKKLPPLGRVVLYGRGLGLEDMEAAQRSLNEKPGITAEILEGGYAAWEMSQRSTTQASGVQDEVENVITYQNLVELHAADAVLVDLRTPVPLARQGDGEEALPQLVSLEKRFPGKPVVTSPFDVAGVPGSGRLARQSDQPLPLMVLIDDGNGKAQEMARVLRANGLQRVVILAGGERIIERDGMSGKQRIGNSSLEGNYAE